MRILIVEDEPVIAMLLTDNLEGAGHAVIGPASTFTEAIALCEASRPDLALLDINLRDGSSGVDVARALRRRWGILSIFTSGQAEDARGARDVALGYIRKPYRAETVLSGVEAARDVMGGKRPASAPAGLELFSPAAG